jgi:hypothetical protein
VTTVLIGALVGGAIGWLWGAISWAALPWHHATFLSFRDEDEIARVMLAQAPRSGVYGLPSPPKHDPSLDKAAREARDRAAQEQMRRGPVVTAVIQRDGFGSVPLAILRAFVIYVAAAAVLTWLLQQVGGAPYWQQVRIVTAVGLAAALICRLPDWNWHGYSTSFTLVHVADHVVGAFLVGLGLAAVV